jgi:uncharacterized tellurite resistance protein B-like protein
MNFADLLYAKTGVSFDLGSLADDPEGQALVASLLALVARCDGVISREETMRMVELLQSRFHLGADEAVILVNRAVNEFGADADLEGLVANINEELSLSEKETLISIVLHVISADDSKNAQEMDLLATLIHGLKIPDKIMEKAYEKYFQDRQARD